MTDSAGRGLPIGAVARLTGLSGHTLRKWESRYAVVTPMRTETGRRIYSDADVARLRLVRELAAGGHQLAQLSGLSNEALQQLLHSSAAAPRPHPGKVLIVGLVLAELARRAGSELATEIRCQSQHFEQWLSTDPILEDGEAVVVEVPALTSHLTDRLAELADDHQMVVVYGFAQSRHLAALRLRGAVCLRGPVDVEAIGSALQEPVPSREGAPLPRRFSDEAIARVSAAPSRIQCECPGQVASLLFDLIAFERYSMACEAEQSLDVAMHRYLADVAGRARAEFEEALEHVARQEGIALTDVDYVAK